MILAFHVSYNTARKASLSQREWRRQLRKKRRATHLEKERKGNSGKNDTW